MSDLISRQAAIDAIVDLWADKPFGNPALTEIKERIEKLPSAEPERKPEQTASARDYCAECNHIEMCSWYPYEGCEFRFTGTERKKGKWMPYHEEGLTVKCSECGSRYEEEGE